MCLIETVLQRVGELTCRRDRLRMLAPDAVFDGLTPLEALSRGSGMQEKVMRLVRSEADGDGFSRARRRAARRAAPKLSKSRPMTLFERS
jgi:hypothetical protein